MKKFLLCLLMMCFSLNCCFADELRLDLESKYQKKVMQIGFRILNANGIDKRMVFSYVPEKKVNAGAFASSKNIVVYKGLLPYFDTDDELAAVLSHEIAHGLDYHAGFWRRMAMAMSSKKYEEKADKKGIDLMVNAGYNPVAMIIALNKIASEENWYERNATHPVGSDRLAYIYEYIYAKYPAYLADNEFRTNLYYQNFLLTSQKDREEIRKKYSHQYTPVSNIKAK